MNKALVATCLSLAFLPLAGCMSEGYGGGLGGGYGPGYAENYAYNGWYDGAYGSIYDGYWGTDGVFYYRQSAQDRAFRRGDAHHFQRGDAAQPGAQYQRLEGTTRPAQGRVRAPHFPGQGQGQQRGDRKRN